MLPVINKINKPDLIDIAHAILTGISENQIAYYGHIDMLMALGFMPTGWSEIKPTPQMQLMAAVAIITDMPITDLPPTGIGVAYSSEISNKTIVITKGLKLFVIAG